MPLTNCTRRLQAAVRIALATVFLYAAAMKVLREDEKQVPSTIFMEWSHLAFVRYLIIGGEAGLAVWLFVGIEIDVASIVAMATLSAFTSLIICEFNVEHPKPCGCTGTYVVAADPRAIRASLRVDLVRNAVMMCGTVWLYISERVLTSATAKSPKLRVDWDRGDDPSLLP